MHIEKLPTEILINIFRLVSQRNVFTALVAIPSVNQKWRYISLYFLSDIDVRISQISNIRNKKIFLYKFLNNIKGIKNLYFDCFFDLKHEFWNLFSIKFQHLEKIDFTNYNRHNFGLNFNLHKTCPNLKTIIFSSFMWINIFDLHRFKKLKNIKIPYNTRVTFDDYKKMFSIKQFSLESLDLKDCKNLTEDNLELIGKNCPNLKKIDIRGCDNCLDKNLLDKYFHNLDTYKCFCDYEDIFDILIRKNIQKIYIEEYYYLGNIYKINNGVFPLKSLTINDSNVTDAFIDKLIKCCPCIKVLNFDNCHNITDNSLVNIINNCEKLEILKFNTCENIIFKSTNKIVKRAENIKIANFDFLNYVRCLSNVIGFLPNLTKLSLEYTLNAKDVYKYLTPKMKYLNIPGIFYNENQYRVLCRNCPNLIYLNNNDNIKFNQKCLNIIMNNCIYINYIFLKRIPPLDFNLIIDKIYHKNIIKWCIENKNYNPEFKFYVQKYPKFEKNVMSTWSRI